MKNSFLSKLDFFLNNRKEEISALRREGEKVFGYVCCKVPVEIPYALGMIPIRIGIADETKMAKGAQYTHQFTCPYVKCIVGEMLEEGDFFYNNVDVLSGYVTCIALHRCLEVLKLYTDKPTIYITHPLNPPGEKEKRFYDGEVNFFIRKLEEITEIRLNSQNLKESVNLFNKIRETLMHLYKLQAFGEVFKWSDMLKIVHTGFLLDPVQYLEFLEELVKGIKGNEIENSTNTPRIMLVGSPILPGDNLLIKLIEESGARIVADMLCTGLRSFEDLIIQEPTIAGIRETYLNSNPCATAQDLKIEDDRRLNHILRIIKEYKVQGVIYYALRFCDHYAFKDDETKDFLRDKAGIPMLAIHSEYGEAEGARLKTRIEGFIETLKI
jgi:benzoyl-CoA reductase/2-hydroxyglutaryl-CoA dehydratase subunit BcrC/BadD/HgdB